MSPSVVLDQHHRPTPPGVSRPPLSRNRLLAWGMGLAVLVIAVSVVVLKIDRIDEGNTPNEYPGVVSAEHVDTP